MRWSWGTDLVTPAVQAITEAICLYAYVVVLAPPNATHPGFTIIASLFVLAAWLGRWSTKHPRYGRPDLWLLLIASLLVPPVWWLAMLAPAGGWAPQAWLTLVGTVWRGDTISAGVVFILTVLVLAVWCRGLALGMRPADPETLSRRLVGGVAAMLVLFFVLAIAKGTGVERFTGTLQSLVLVYFVVAPTMLALVHLDTLHRGSAARQSVSFAWIVAVAAPVSMIVAVGLSISFGVAPLLQQMLHGVLRLWLLLWRVIVWVLYWPLVLLDWLFDLLRAVLSAAPPPGGQPQIPPPRPLPPSVDIFGARSDLLFDLLTATAILAGVFFMYRLARRSRTAPARDIDEERSSAWSWVLFCAQCAAAWWALRSQIRRRRGALFGTAMRREATAHQVRPPTDIRAVYRDLLRWAAVHGHPRRPATTPEELRRELTAAMPRTSASVTLITSHYEVARYGGAEITSDALAASKVAGEQLSDAQE